MEPIFQKLPLYSTQNDASNEAIINEIKENSLRYKSFNKNEIKYLYNTLIDNCIYFLETTYESLYASSYTFSHHEFHTFAEEVIRKARITIPLLYSIMYCIKRFRTSVKKCPKIILGLNQGVSIKEPKDLYKIFVTAAVLSLKFFNDRVILNVEWTKFIDITVEEINLCERQFFKFIDYNLNLNSKNYYVFINDYLNKFNNKSALPSKPSFKSYSTPSLSSSHDCELQPVITINNQISNNQQKFSNTPFNAHLSQPNVNRGNTSNTFLSITPTPSLCSQSSPYTNTVDGNGDKPLTPNEIYMEYNQQNQQHCLYSDPMNVDENMSPQKSQYDNFNSNIKINRKDTQRTLCNDTQTTPFNEPNNFQNIKRNDTQSTLCNESNLLINTNENIAICNEPTAYSTYFPINSPNDNDNINCHEYHPSEDEILREHLNNNTEIPLNKLLYNLHHYQMKMNQQNSNQYSNNEKSACQVKN